MRYPCLVLDHDDTLVRSTPEIHFPSFVETVRLLRPRIHRPTLGSSSPITSTPAFCPCAERLPVLPTRRWGLSQEIWKRYTQRVPDCYEGLSGF